MDTEELVEDFLEHHGIKGQKWGVRNNRRRPGTKSKVQKSGRRARKFDTNQLTNKELKKVIDRMEMERKYVDLNSKAKNEGKTFTKKVLLGVISAAALKGGEELAKHYVNKMVKKASQ